MRKNNACGSSCFEKSGAGGVAILILSFYAALRSYP
jgi:hypothetical protein